MTDARGDFDPIGIVIDWLDACREGRLGDLLDIYAEAATLACCDGQHFAGRSGLVAYWSDKLRDRTAGAFELDEIVPEDGAVRLDYRDFDGRAVRTRFWFADGGRIMRTACEPMDREGRSRAA